MLKAVWLEGAGRFLFLIGSKRVEQSIPPGGALVVMDDGYACLVRDIHADRPMFGEREPIGQIWGGLRTIQANPGPGIPNGANCVIVPRGAQVTEELVWEFALTHRALIPRDPHEEADHGDQVIIMFKGINQQETLDQTGLTQRLQARAVSTQGE